MRRNRTKDMARLASLSTVCWLACSVIASAQEASGSSFASDDLRAFSEESTAQSETGRSAESRRAIALGAARASKTSDLPYRLTPVWGWSGLGSGIGESGLEVVDLDGVGGQEIVVSASAFGFGPTRHWHILRWDGVEYRHVFTSPFAQDDVTIAVAQMDAVFQLEVVVAGAGFVEIWDGATHTMQSTFAVETETKVVKAGDIDADGVPEVVVCDGLDLHSYDSLTKERELVRYGFGCHDLALAQIDDDPALEILVTNGDVPAYALDGASGLVDWGTKGGLGWRIAVGDLTGDGRDEVVGNGGSNTLVVWDLAENELLWSQPVDRLGSVAVADISPSPGLEVIWASTERVVHVLDAAGVELWSAPNPDRGTTRLAVGDGDDDGQDEVYWGGNFSSSGPDHLIALDPLMQQVEWVSDESAGPTVAVQLADVDADGEDEIVVVDSGVGDDDFLGFLVFDQSPRMLASKITTLVRSTDGAWGLGIVQADGDPALELCSSGNPSNRGRVVCVDAVTHDVEWTVALPSSVQIRSLIAGDLGASGVKLLLGAKSQSTSMVYALDPETGFLFWRTPEVAWRRDLEWLGVLPGTDLVVAAALVGFVGVWDGASGLPLFDPFELPFFAMMLSEASRRYPPILMELNPLSFWSLDPLTGTRTEVGPAPDSRAVALETVDLPGSDGVLLVSTGEELLILDGIGGPIVGQLDGFDDLARANRWSVVETKDGARIFATTRSGAVEIQVEMSPELFSDGFESGDTTAWDSGAR